MEMYSLQYLFKITNDYSRGIYISRFQTHFTSQIRLCLSLNHAVELQSQPPALPLHSTLTYHPGNPPLTLGIASWGQHGDRPTLSHLGGVDGSRLCHGPGWGKKALSVKVSSTLLYCVWSLSALSQPAWKVIPVAKVHSVTIILADTHHT